MAILQQEIEVWGDKWSPALLEQKKQDIGDREFSRGWRQRAISDDEVLFREETIKQCLDKKSDLYFPDYDDFSQYPKTHGIYMGVDLAIANASKAGDYFVICVIGVDKNFSKRHLIGFYRNRGLSFNEQLQKLGAWTDFFKPNLVLVENNSYQDAFVQEVVRTTDVSVKAFTTTGLNKSHIELGLPRVSVEFENKKWIIPQGNVNTRKVLEPLLEELRTYPLGKHDDSIMALWFARNAAADYNRIVRKRIRFL